MFTNQHLLDAEAKEVSSQAERFKKLSHEWFGLFEKFNLSLKELGDMSNWATVIETDAREVCSSPRFIFLPPPAGSYLFTYLHPP